MCCCCSPSQANFMYFCRLAVLVTSISALICYTWDISRLGCSDSQRSIGFWCSKETVWELTISINKHHNDTTALHAPLQRCSARKHVVFLKTHKTGSSTLNNIFNRFAYKNGLKVALPPKGMYRFSWPSSYSSSDVFMAEEVGERAFHMIVNHAVYNRTEMDKTVPSDSKYITILRNPVMQFQSSFYYFEFDRVLGLTNSSHPIREFLEAPRKYLQLNSALLDREKSVLIQNNMLYDLGVTVRDKTDDLGTSLVGGANNKGRFSKLQLKKVFEKLDNEFNLVMIADYFDESLILLKNELCWSFEDILYLKQNKRVNKKPLLGKYDQGKIKFWNRADYFLYKYFNETLWRKVDHYGDKFWSDLKHFREMNEKFKSECSLKKTTTKHGRVLIEKISSTNEQASTSCKLSLKTPIEFVDLFRHQYGLSLESRLPTKSAEEVKNRSGYRKR